MASRLLVDCAGVAPAMKAVGRDFVPHPMVTGIIANPRLNGEMIRSDGAIRMAPR